MKKIIYHIVLGCTAVIMAVACKDNHNVNPYDSNDSVAPGIPVVTNVKSTAGGAVITYNVPDDDDLMYVRALFTDTHGKIRESRASLYVDSIKIEGLGDTNLRTVEMCAVDRNGNSSETIFIDITPDTPPVALIAKSFKEQADWGGFLLDYKNSEKAEVGVYVVYSNPNTDGEILHDIYFTSKPNGTLAVRGLEGIETEFGVFVVDKWDNSSDTIRFNLRPWPEVEVKKKDIRLVPRVLNDVEWASYAGNPMNLWDNIMPGSWNFAHTGYPLAFPHGITFDLAVSVKPSRFKMWQYLGGDGDYYAHGVPRHFLVYGAPEGSDPYSANSWTLLLDQFLNKPSGGEFTDPNTPDDMEEAQRGHEFTFDLDAPKIRYFRFISLASWSGMEVSRIAEFSLWGDVE